MCCFLIRLVVVRKASCRRPSHSRVTYATSTNQAYNKMLRDLDTKALLREPRIHDNESNFSLFSFRHPIVTAIKSPTAKKATSTLMTRRPSKASPEENIAFFCLIIVGKSLVMKLTKMDTEPQFATNLPILQPVLPRLSKNLIGVSHPHKVIGS